ncbi:Nucleoporin SEH1 [Balamuthia mandrillaris]
MKTFHRFPTEHKDIIHDVSYDFYGKRLATCSSDQRIKVWDLDEHSNWTLTAEWKAHKGSVWRVEWAHPEFGQILASCSFDRTVCIWEEGEEEEKGKGTKWHKKIELLDSKDSVKDIKFAPHHMGLKLATCSADGYSHKGGSSSISWNPSPFDRPSMVVGSGDPDIKVWDFNEAQGRWKVAYTLSGHTDEVHAVAWAPNLGRTFNLIASSSKDKTIRIWKLPTTHSTTLTQPIEAAVLKYHNDAVWRVEWNITGTILASSGDDGTVCLWKADFKGQWLLLTTINEEDDDHNI